MSDGKLLGRYDAAAVERMFADAGIFASLGRRGFSEGEVEVSGAGSPLTHAKLFGWKEGVRHCLFDACLTQATLAKDYFSQRGTSVDHDLRIAVVFWAREGDPTREFSADRPRLPLQDHPGLGILRRVFRVAVRMASDLGVDGLANFPKFPHDAAIFYRSRLFLFLDGEEQGRFEAILRDLGSLGLRDMSLAFVGDAVRDQAGHVVAWRPGFQVYPLSTVLSDYFHSDAYVGAVDAGIARARYHVDAAALETALRVYEQAAA